MRVVKSDKEFINKIEEIFKSSERLNILHTNSGVQIYVNGEVRNPIVQPKDFALQLSPKELMYYLAVYRDADKFARLSNMDSENGTNLISRMKGEGNILCDSVVKGGITDKLLILYLFFSCYDGIRTMIHHQWERFNSGFNYKLDPERYVNLLNQAENYRYRDDHVSLLALEKAIWIYS